MTTSTPNHPDLFFTLSPLPAPLSCFFCQWQLQDFWTVPALVWLGLIGRQREAYSCSVQMCVILDQLDEFPSITAYNICNNDKLIQNFYVFRIYVSILILLSIFEKDVSLHT